MKEQRLRIAPLGLLVMVLLGCGSSDPFAGDGKGELFTNDEVTGKIVKLASTTLGTNTVRIRITVTLKAPLQKPFVFADCPMFYSFDYLNSNDERHSFERIGQYITFRPELMTRIPAGGTLTFEAGVLVTGEGWRKAQTVVFEIEPISDKWLKAYPKWKHPFVAGLISKPVRLEYQP